jgi:hypothetical protein
MIRATTSNETFDLLSYKDIDKSIQGLFAQNAIQDEKGQIVFDFLEREGEVVDTEILGLYQCKQPSRGISIASLTESTRLVFVSDSYASLIYFADLYKSRIALEEAGFIVIGAEFDGELLQRAFETIPEYAKVNTVFGSTILGRMMDCKVQDLIYNRNCNYTLSDDWVRLQNLKTGKGKTESISTFSLRTYCISQGLIQTVRTFKPKQKGVETFYQLHQQNWNEPN